MEEPQGSMTHQAHRLLRAARLLLAATYPTFFLKTFQEAARAHQDTLVESLVNLCDLDPEEFEPEAFVAKGYEEVRHRLPESMDVVLGPVMRSGLETAVGGALEARARLLGMSQAVETSIDYFEVKFQGQKLRMTFQLLCGDADITNEDEKANAPDADRLVRESLGAGATVNLESIEKVETGGTEAFFVFEVFYERTLDLQELVENTLGAKVRAALAKIAVQETT